MTYYFIDEGDFEAFLWDTTNEDFDMYPNYSGRGMYGDQCVGVVVHNFPKFLIELGVAIGEGITDEYDIPRSAWEKVNYDNMGLDTIIYWPRIQLKEDDDDE